MAIARKNPTTSCWSVGPITVMYPSANSPTIAARRSGIVGRKNGPCRIAMIGKTRSIPPYTTRRRNHFFSRSAFSRDGGGRLAALGGASATAASTTAGAPAASVARPSRCVVSAMPPLPLDRRAGLQLVPDLLLEPGQLRRAADLVHARSAERDLDHPSDLLLSPLHP